MKNLKTLLSQNLTWTFSKKKITLKSNDATVLELQEEKHSKASFIFEDQVYIIRNTGFWNAKTTIESDGKQMLMLKRNFLGSKGTIDFDNGNHYSCKISNSPLAKLSFLDKDGKEILYYKLDATQKPKTVVSIVDQSIREIELLMMIVLGCYSFQGIVQENDDATFMLLVAGA
jgi:hypothetical protein